MQMYTYCKILSSKYNFYGTGRKTSHFCPLLLGGNHDDASERSLEERRRKIDRNLMAFTALDNKFETLGSCTSNVCY